MCLIIHKPAGVSVPEEHIYNAWDNNSDGFGAMWVEDGRVRVTQGIWGYERIAKFMHAHRNREIAVHFRYATAGSVTLQNVHPFKVLDYDRDGEDLWLMHNGTFTFPKPTDGHSDTWLFAQKLRPVLRKVGTAILHDPIKRARMGEEIAKYNKVLFMSGSGDVMIVNKTSGVEINTAWYSNEYSLEGGYRDNKDRLWYTRGNSRYNDLDYGYGNYGSGSGTTSYSKAWAEKNAKKNALVPANGTGTVMGPKKPATAAASSPKPVKGNKGNQRKAVLTEAERAEIMEFVNEAKARGTVTNSKRNSEVHDAGMDAANKALK